ncbi:MAG: nucleotidyltransferase domain-containing protein [Chitinivibrionales bacterium]|nr:nucleotidyltransferase domain-containing protein [Chitinivibrionales bacterium]
MNSNETRQIIKNLITKIGCTQCILFGSRARGEESMLSDYDLLLIMDRPLSVREKIKLASQLRGEFAEKGIDADIILKTKQDIQNFKNKTGSIVKHALAEGIPAW